MFKSYSLVKNAEPIDPEKFSSTLDTVTAGKKTRHYANLKYNNQSCMFETGVVEAVIFEDKENDSGKFTVGVRISPEYIDALDQIQKGLVKMAIEHKAKFNASKLDEENWKDHMRCIYKYPRKDKESDELDETKTPSCYLMIGKYSKFDVYKGKQGGVHQWDKDVKPSTLQGKTLKCKVKFNVRSLYRHQKFPIGMHMYISNCSIVDMISNDGSMDDDEDLLDFIDKNQLTGVSEDTSTSAEPAVQKLTKAMSGTTFDLGDDDDTADFLADE